MYFFLNWKLSIRMVLIRIRYRVLYEFQNISFVAILLKKSSTRVKEERKLVCQILLPQSSPLDGAVVRTNNKWKYEYNSKKSKSIKSKEKKLKLYVFLVCRIKQRDSQIKVLMPQPVHKLLKLP